MTTWREEEGNGERGGARGKRQCGEAGARAEKNFWESFQYMSQNNICKTPFVRLIQKNPFILWAIQPVLESMISNMTYLHIHVQDLE